MKMNVNTPKSKKNISSVLFANMDKGVLTNADMRQKKYVALYAV